MMIGLMAAVVAFLIDSFIWFPLHLSANVSLLWLFIGLTMVMGIKKNGKLEAEEKIITRGINHKQKAKNNIYKFKPVLYIIVILLAAFLCITVARPFMAKIVWFSGFKEVEDKDWEKATEIYESALKLDPYLGALYYDLGKVFLKRGLGNTALKSFKKAERYIDFPGLPLNIAIIYLAKGDTDNGIIELKRAISYQPVEKMPLLYVELGNVYLQFERYESAEIAFKNAIKINSNLLTDDSLKQNKTDEELAELRNKINSNLVGAHYKLAEAYLRRNKVEEGLVELKKVVELGPESEQAKYARDIIQKIEQAKLDAKDSN